MGFSLVGVDEFPDLAADEQDLLCDR